MCIGLWVGGDKALWFCLFRCYFNHATQDQSFLPARGSDFEKGWLLRRIVIKNHHFLPFLQAYSGLIKRFVVSQRSAKHLHQLARSAFLEALLVLETERTRVRVRLQKIARTALLNNLGSENFTSQRGYEVS